MTWLPIALAIASVLGPALVAVGIAVHNRTMQTIGKDIKSVADHVKGK